MHRIANISRQCTGSIYNGYKDSFLYPKRIFSNHQQTQHYAAKHTTDPIYIASTGDGPKLPLYFDAFRVMIPHPAKRHRGGEDATFCSTSCLVVADGVGGWESSGIDAGLYSRELVNRISEEFDRQAKASSNLDLLQILKNAYVLTREIGSSTCCLAVIDPQNSSIKTANLGDSGFILYRPSENKIVGRSEFQCHSFNFPVQLGTGSSDMPEHADFDVLHVKENDVLLLASDGVWDNLHDEHLITILQQESSPRTAAEDVALASYELSLDPDWLSPFALKEREFNEAFKNCTGGKSDDISVIVAVIRRGDTVKDQ